MLVALLLSLQTVAAPRAGGDVLDELIAKTSQLKSFTATYAMTDVTTDVTPAKTHAMQTRIDFQAPDKMRLETHMGADSMSQWLIDGVITMRCDGEDPMHARIDMLALFGEFAPIQRALDDAFPGARIAHTELQAVARMRWSFDEGTQKANFELALALEESVETPLGWLGTLRSKGEKATDSGNRLLFDNDGHFKVALSKDTGFVETLDGKSPHAELHIQLESLERDAAIDLQRFVLPSTLSEGTDLSDPFRNGISAQIAASLRERIYSKIAGSAGDAWSETERAKITTVLRAYREYMLRSGFEDLRKWAQKRSGEVATWLHQRLDEGDHEDEVARDRDAQIAKLDEALDKQSSDYSARLAVPANSPPFPRGDELLKLEREVATKAFDELVRAPIVHDFEHATSLKKE